MNLIEEIIQPAVEFLEKIKQKNKVAIVHGHDNDSVCSAAIIYKLLKIFYKIEPMLIVSGLNSSVTMDVLDNVKKNKPDYVIILDIPDVNVSIITELRNISHVMIIDHHMPKGYVKITYVNPRVFDRESYLPTSYLCYKIYEKFLDTDEILWIAGVGTLFDMGLKNCNDLFVDIRTKNKELVEDNENIDEILLDNSLLGKLVKIFDSARIVKGIVGTVTALNVMINVKDYQEVLKTKYVETKKLLEWYGISEKEFNRLVKDFEKKKRRINRIVLYGVKSKYNMKSSIASYLTRRMTNEVLVIYQRFGKFADVSFRKGKVSIVDLNQLASDSIKSIPDSQGGGHIQAAGCRFPINYWSRFLRNLRVFR